MLSSLVYVNLPTLLSPADLGGQESAPDESESPVVFLSGLCAFLRQKRFLSTAATTTKLIL